MVVEDLIETALETRKVDGSENDLIREQKFCRSSMDRH